MWSRLLSDAEVRWCCTLQVKFLVTNLKSSPTACSVLLYAQPAYGLHALVHAQLHDTCANLPHRQLLSYLLGAARRVRVCLENTSVLTLQHEQDTMQIQRSSA